MANISVYLDSDVCRWQLDESNLVVKRYFDLDQFERDQNIKKVSVFHTPYPYLKVKKDFEKRVDRAFNASHQLVILTSELHDETVDFILNHSHPKILHLVCGTVDGIETKKWMDWFITSTDFYKQNPILETLTPYALKEKTFDILLGQQKYHRNIIYNYIKQQQLDHRVVMTYLNNLNKIVEGVNNNGWIWPAGDLKLLDKDLRGTISQVLWQGQDLTLSQVVPINIYNQTAYSIVAETKFSNHYSFYTEKTVKPILGKRLFLAFSGQHFLQNLRSMGFKTFDGIIDESYDLVSDIDLRGKLIIQQMEYLFNQDQHKILESVKPIAEHNYKILMETPWHELSQFEFKTAITNIS